MDALEYRIKKALDYVIAETFPNEDIPKMKVEFMAKETKSFHGDYNCKTQKTRIGNLSRPPVHIIITSLHEAAHHCEYAMTGKTGHQKSFYVIYNKLMITAIRIGLFDYETARTMTDTSCIRQLERHCGPITETASPERRYKKDRILIYVFYGYNFRQELQRRGYFYNSRAKAWEREMAKTEEGSERAFLGTLSDSIIVWVTDNMLDLTVFATITVTGKTYGCKDILLSLNFNYRKKSLPGSNETGWFKRVRSTELKDYQNAIKILSNTPGVIVDVKY